MGERSVLQRHPELAPLWMLRYSGRVALKSMEYARLSAVPLLVRPAMDDLRRSIDDMVRAVERYKAVVERDNGRPDEVQVMIPPNWTTAQADAVFMFLSRVTEGLWEAHEDKLVLLAMQESSVAEEE